MQQSIRDNEERLRVVGWKLHLVQGSPLVVMEPNHNAVPLLSSEVIARVRMLFDRYGAVLIQQGGCFHCDEFARFVERVSLSKLLPYEERSSPRRPVGHGVYTSTQYSPKERIAFHNENSYQLSWPGLIAFWCDTPPSKGGETPIVDVRKVLLTISNNIKRKFSRKGYAIVRNYSEHLGLPWQEVFQTTSKSKVAEYCKRNKLELQWTETGLRTVAKRPIIRQKAGSSEDLWFNHMSFFNVRSLRTEIREGLLRLMDVVELPVNTYFGDGTTISDATIDEVLAAYESHAFRRQWSAADILLLDNMVFAHGREAFCGARSVNVALSRLVHSVTD